MSGHIIDTVAELPKVCEHINLPFQAGDDDVLSRMRREYTNTDYRRLVNKIRDRIPNVSMTTDLIVGFCGETDEQFNRTYEMVRDVRFDKVHSAMYSTRDNTFASRKFEDDVSQEEKKRRLTAIDELQASIQAEINSKLMDETLEVLVEGTKRGQVHGRSRSDKLVYVEGGEEVIGHTAPVRIERAGPWSLGGRIALAA